MEFFLFSTQVFIVMVITYVRDSITHAQCTAPPVCHCDVDHGKFIVQCSRAGLVHIPTFEGNATHIYLNNNPIAAIESNVFPRTTVYLNLSWCEIKVIEIGAFRFLPYLQVLDISFNRELTYLGLPNVTSDLQFTSIRSLNLSAIHCMWGDGTVIRLPHLRMLQNTSLVELDLASNRISHFEVGVISSLPPSLERLNFADNALQAGSYMYELLSLPNMRYIDVSDLFKNDHSYIPIFRIPCNDTRAIPCNVDSLSTVGLNRRKQCDRTCMRKRLDKRKKSTFQFLHKVFTLIVYCPPKLETARIENSAVHDKGPDANLIYNSTTVRNVYLKGNHLQSLVRPPFNMDSLILVDISHNLVSYMAASYFRYVHNLQHLLLSNNFLGTFFEHKDSEDVFSNTRKLIDLEISQNRIRSITPKIFRYLDRIEYLDISKNELTGLDFRLSHMTHLRLLNLSSNQVRYFSTDNMEDIDAIMTSENLTIDLTKNRLLCDCSTLPFLTWLQTDSRIFYSFDDLICDLTNNTEMRMAKLETLLHQFELQCRSKTKLIIVVVSFITIALSAIVAGVIHRYRWSIRYLFYAAKREYRKYFHQADVAQRETHFTFDAFVSYSDEDRSIPTTYFINELESKSDNKINLCLHNRNFIPGLDIEENISNAVHNSRKTVCLLSKNYFESHWCMFEYNMARMESIYFRNGEDILFLVLLEDFNVRDVPMSVLQMIESKSYLEYPHDDQENPAFWAKLKEVIGQ